MASTMLAKTVPASCPRAPASCTRAFMPALGCTTATLRASRSSVVSCKALAASGPAAAPTFGAPSRPERVSAQKTRATDSDVNLTDGVEGYHDYYGLITVAAYAAMHFGHLHVDRTLLLKALAAHTLFNAAVGLATRRSFADRVSAVVGPAALSIYVLNFAHISFLDAVTGLFGYYLAESIEPKSLFWVWIATLAAAIYYNYGTLWYAAATGLVSVYKLLKAGQEDRPIPFVLIGAAAASAFAIYKEQHFVWALILYLSQIAWHFVGTVAGLAKSFD